MLGLIVRRSDGKKIQARQKAFLAGFESARRGLPLNVFGGPNYKKGWREGAKEAKGFWR